MAEEHSALKNHFLKLFGHMRWADMNVLNLIEKEKVSNGKPVDLLSHVVLAEETWMKRITGQNYDTQVWKPLSVKECRILAEKTNAKFMEYITSLPEEDFWKNISYKTSKGVDYTTQVEDILTHVALHGMYHRGQIILQMRNEKKDVVATDYVLFVR